jgi:hypothetical protein
LAWAIGLASSPEPATAETQTLSFSSPGWHFISLSVRPANPDPMDVFTPGLAFDYDQLWEFDPVDGWRHFSPDPAVPGLLNDLIEIKPLRGYWIHLTRVADGGFDLAVDGTRVSTLELDPALDRADRWQTIGPLLDAGETIANVDSVFSELGSALPTLLLEIWDYDESTRQYREITSFDASCGSTPDDCLQEGQGYWVRTDGRIALGPSLTTSTDGILLSVESPLERIDIQYAGGIGVAARLRAIDPNAGISFVAARASELDGNPIVHADFASDPSGPDTQADLDGDLDLENCPDLCVGVPSCVSLCFDGGSATGAPEDAEHTVYALVDYETLVDPATPTTNLQPGSAPHTEIALEVLAQGAAQIGSEADPVAMVEVAVQPSTLEGVYSGSLLYESAGGGKVPITLWLTDPGTRVSAVINPTLVSSRQNAFDDDGDRETDELDEGNGLIVPTRTSAGFPRETILIGEISPDGQRLRLRGEIPAIPALAFADGPDAGVAVAFAQASRELTLEGERLDADIFDGYFSDQYASLSLGPVSSTVSEGRFYLERVAAPTCVVPIDYSDPDVKDSDRPLSFGIDCRSDADCPGRCVGDPKLEGFFCTSDLECRGNVVDGVFDPAQGAVVPVSQGFVTGTCERLSCAFAEFAPGSASATASAFEPARISIAGLDRIAVVTLSGPEERSFVLDATTGVGRDVGALACGTYEVGVVASGCDPLTPLTDPPTPPPTFDPCSDPQVEVEELVIQALTCPDPPVVGANVELASTGGIYTFRGGAVLAGERLATGGVAPDDFVLSGSGGESGVAGRGLDTDWTNELSWPATAVVVRTGLEEVLR